MPNPEGTSVQFITVMCDTEEFISITMAAMGHRDPDGHLKPLTVNEYLLMCHRERMAREGRR